jgi:ribosomal protein S18 acetylase RimI-like enzyme
MRTIQRATMDDLPDILGLLNNARAWLRDKGIEQWPNQFTEENVGPDVAMAEMWLVKVNEQPAATVRATANADPAFWAPDEAADLAIYISRLAVDRPGQHSGLGNLVLRWVTDYAARLGYKYVRLDCRRDNDSLQDYYRERGWRYLRTVPAPDRFSGALFERPAAADLEARDAFSPPPSGWLDPGTPVTVQSETGTEHGTVLGIHVPWVDDEHTGSTGVVPFTPGYEIRLEDGRLITAERRLVSARRSTE